MNARLVTDRFPFLPLRLNFPGSSKAKEIEVEALIDAGFDGGLIIPSRLLGNVNLIVIHVNARLADGRGIELPSYVARVELAGLEGFHTVLVSAFGDEALAGRSLTDRFRLTLDHGRELTVEL